MFAANPAVQSSRDQSRKSPGGGPPRVGYEDIDHWKARQGGMLPVTGSNIAGNGAHRNASLLLDFCCRSFERLLVSCVDCHMDTFER
jgi:hypothetical protein